MTRKLEDIKDFATFLKKEGYHSQIPISHIKYYIAMKFGTSKYIMSNILENLVTFGFLKNVGVGIFQMCDGWTPGNKKITEEAEKEATKEVDALLEKVENADA